MALTCLSSPGTRSIPVATGWAAKRSSACKPGRHWTGQPTDYWAPTNWLSLDQGDTDLGGVSAMLIDVPGANPSQLVLAIGKDSNAYLINRNNLGGISGTSLPAKRWFRSAANQSATYTTSQGTYFVFAPPGARLRLTRLLLQLRRR